MTPAQINCFLEVARCQSFSKAAAHLFISQPAVSKQLSQLEKDLGYILIDRSYGRAILTPVGQLCFDFFTRMEHEFDALKAEANRITSGHMGDIRLGCLDGWDLSTFYPELKGLLVEKYPDLRLHLDGYNHIQVLDALKRTEIDVAITLEITLRGQAEFSHRNMTSAPAVILISSLHPLAHKEDLSLYDLRDDPFYIISPSSHVENPMKQLAVNLCQQAGFEPKLEYIPNSASVLMRLQAGTGVQVTCAWTSACKIPMYRVIPLELDLNISAVWLEDDQHPAKRIFIDELYRHYHPIHP